MIDEERYYQYYYNNKKKLITIYFKSRYSKPRSVEIFLSEFKKIAKIIRKAFNNKFVKFNGYIKIIEEGILNAVKYLY